MKKIVLAARFSFGRVLCAVTCMFIASLAYGQQQQFLAWGKGSDSCGSYVLSLQRYGPNEMLQWKGANYGTPTYDVMQWILGFITHENYRRSFLKAPQLRYQGDIAGIALWIKNWCEKNPTSAVADAAGAFIIVHE